MPPCKLQNFGNTNVQLCYAKKHIKNETEHLKRESKR